MKVCINNKETKSRTFPKLMQMIDDPSKVALMTEINGKHLTGMSLQENPHYSIIFLVELWVDFVGDITLSNNLMTTMWQSTGLMNNWLKANRKLLKEIQQIETTYRGD